MRYYFFGALLACALVLVIGAVLPSFARPGPKVETFAFTVTPVRAGLICHGTTGAETACDDRFGHLAGSQADLLVQGMRIGQSYAGEITLLSDGRTLVGGTCRINGRDCDFGLSRLTSRKAPTGPVTRLKLTGPAKTGFEIAFTRSGGRAWLTTVPIPGAPGTHHYQGTEFALGEVRYTLRPKPLSPNALLGLALILGGLAITAEVMQARRSSAAGRRGD